MHQLLLSSRYMLGLSLREQNKSSLRDFSCNCVPIGQAYITTWIRGPLISGLSYVALLRPKDGKDPEPSTRHCEPPWDQRLSMSQQPRRAQSDGVSSGGKSGSNYSCVPRQIWSRCVLPELAYTAQNLAASPFSALA